LSVSIATFLAFGLFVSIAGLLAFTCVMFWPPANGLETKPKLTPTHYALLYTQPSPTYQFTITNQTKPNQMESQTKPHQSNAPTTV
jgi:hypothetical protein